jgi:hypothetical protein
VCGVGVCGECVGVGVCVWVCGVGVWVCGVCVGVWGECVGCVWSVWG